MKQFLHSLAAALPMVATLGCSPAPTNYEDCVLKKLSASMDTSVAEIITDACRRKFSAVEVAREQLAVLPPKAAARLTGQFNIGTSGAFGNMYNGNKKWRLEEFTIVIGEPGWQEKWAAHGKDPTSEKPRIERYKVKVSVPPLTNKSFALEVNWDSDDKFESSVVDPHGVEEP